jgi:hypothetical protein
MAASTYAAPANLPLAARAAPLRHAALQQAQSRLILCPALPRRCRRQQPILSQSASTEAGGGMTGSVSWRTSTGPAPPASPRGRLQTFALVWRALWGAQLTQVSGGVLRWPVLYV